MGVGGFAEGASYARLRPGGYGRGRRETWRPPVAPLGPISPSRLTSFGSTLYTILFAQPSYTLCVTGVPPFSPSPPLPYAPTTDTPQPLRGARPRARNPRMRLGRPRLRP